MKKSEQAFTLVELVVSITIFTIVLGTAFAMFPYLMGSIKKVGNMKFLLTESIKLKEELQFKNKTISFYTYDSLFNLTPTQFDFENRFRRNIKDIVINTIKDRYSIVNYDLNAPEVCELPYSPTQYFSDLDLSIIEDEFELNECLNDINDPLFDSRYKILSVIDKKNLIVNIYFVYKSKLHKISTSLITDLDNDDIIYNRLSSGKISLKIYDGFGVNKFSGSSFNFCSLDNTPGEECSFTDYNKEQDNPGNIDIYTYKLTEKGNEINVKSSYILKILYSLNY